MFAADNQPFLADVGAIIAVFVVDANVVAGKLPVERLRLGKAGERGVFRGGLDLQGELPAFGLGAGFVVGKHHQKAEMLAIGGVDGELVHGVGAGMGKALGQPEKGRAGKQRFRLLLGFQAARAGRQRNVCKPIIKGNRQRQPEKPFRAMM